MHADTPGQATTNSWQKVFAASWAPLLVVFGYVPVTFIVSPLPIPVDLLFHFAGGVAGVYFIERAFLALPGVLGRPGPGALRVIALALFALVALGWEIGEEYLDLTLGTALVAASAGPVPDLACGAAGALGYTAWSWRRARAVTRSQPVPLRPRS